MRRRGITIAQVGEVATEITQREVSRGMALRRVESDPNFPQPICETDETSRQRVRLYDREEVSAYLRSELARKYWPIKGAS